MQEGSQQSLSFAIRHAREAYGLETQVYNAQNLPAMPGGFALEEEYVAEARAACVMENCPQIWIERDKIYHICIRLTDGTLYLLGPACAEAHDEAARLAYAQRHGVPVEQARLRSISATQAVSCASVFCYLVTGIAYRQETILHFNTVLSDLYVSHWLTYRLEAFEKSRRSYAEELDWLERIAAGEVVLDERIVRDNSSLLRGVGKLADTLDKQMEYSLVVALTLISRAAIRGGMEPSDSYNLADTFFQQLPRCRDSHEMLRVYYKAVNAFTGMIRRAKDVQGQSSLVDRCKLYIDHNMYERLTVRQLAEAVGVSPNHLSAVFSRETGTTLTRYIHEKRLDRASELLRYSSMDIGDISERLMFCSQSHFGRLFKEQFGMSPHAYRQHYGVSASNPLS